MSNLNQIHNEGQSNAAEGKPYEPYHSHLEELFTWNSDSLQKLQDENGAYRDGYRNSSND